MTTRNPFAGDPGETPSPLESLLDASTGAGRHGAGEPANISTGARIKALIDPETDLVCCRLPQTHMGLAERWRVRFGADFRFCAEIGWFWWDGARWRMLSEEKEQLPAELTISLAMTVRAVRNEAALVAASGYPTEHLTDKQERELAAWAEAVGTTSRELYLSGDEDGARARWLEEREPMDIVLGKVLWSQKLAAWAKACESGGTIGSTFKWIKGFPDINVRPEQFDTDPLAINVANGTLRLVRKAERRSSAEVAEGKSEWRTGRWSVKLDAHDRGDLITKLAPVKYASRAKCPAYDAFMARVQPDETMRDFLHQWGGYSLTGDTGEHKLAFFYGEGRNGKGTWVEAIAAMAGDYAGSVGIESLLDSGTKRRGDQATPDMAALTGVRFLRVSEPQVGMKFNDGLLKQLTGGDPLKVRHLNKGFFEFFPDFKITLSGNVRPVVKDVSHGMWARLQLVPWEVVIPEEEIDRSLPETLRAEASGIFNRLIEGLLQWREGGLIVPEKVKEATRQYRDASDQLGRFLRDCCEVGGDARKVRAGATELWEVFEAWCAATGAAEWKRAGFVKAMEDRRFTRITSNGVWWEKVRLRPGVTLEAVKAGVWPGLEAAANGGKTPGPPAGSLSGSGADSSAGDPGKGAGSGFEGGENDDLPEWD